MSIANPSPATSQHRVPSFLDSALAGFAWAEAFVWLGVHSTWILGKSTPLGVENSYGMLLAVFPILVLLAVSLLTKNRAFRSALLGIEWLLHLSSSALLSVLVLYVTLRDPFSPALPHSWSLGLWAFGMTFALLGSLAGHERRRDAHANALTGGLTGWGSLIMAVVWWGGALWVASGMAWPTYFWTASILLHAAMAPVSVLAARAVADEPARQSGTLRPLAAGLEGLLLFAALFSAQLRFILTCEQTGTLELKYVEFLGPHRVPLFLAGTVLALLANRFRLTLITHAALAGLAFFASNATEWAIPLIMGYGLVALFSATGQQCAVGRTISMTAMGVVWLMGVMGFSLAGFIVFRKMHLGLVEDLLKYCKIGALLLYAVWGLPAAFSIWGSSRAESAPRRHASARAQALVFVSVAALFLVPAAGLMFAKLWPPMLIQRAPQVDVEKPTGLCHAGYSKSDKEYALLKDLGASMMRVDFHWHGVQPDPDTWDFSRWDAYLDAAEKHGTRVLAILAFDNNAVETDPVGKERGKYIAPKDVPLFLEYVKRITTRYKDRVYAWEIWNEADMRPRFWDGPREEFYELARRTAETVYEVDPALNLVGTAMTGPLGSWTTTMIDGMHESGALERVDHPGAHCYVSDPRTYYREFQKIILSARKHGHPGSPWFTELGDPDGGIYFWRASSTLLAEHAMKSHVIATSLGIEKLVWYCLRDSDVKSIIDEPKESERFFGLVKRNNEYKPAAYAYRLFAHNCSDSTIRSDLVDVSGGLGARQLRTALYRRENGDSALVLWYEPALTQGGSARVHLDLGELTEPAISHDITSAYTKLHLDGVIDVSEHPVFITFKPVAPEQPVTMRVTASPVNELWLLALFGAVVAGFCAALRTKRGVAAA